MAKFKVGDKIIVLVGAEEPRAIPSYASKYGGTIAVIRETFNNLYLAVCFDGNILYLYDEEILLCDDAHKLLYSEL